MIVLPCFVMQVLNIGCRKLKLNVSQQLGQICIHPVNNASCSISNKQHEKTGVDNVYLAQITALLPAKLDSEKKKDKISYLSHFVRLGEYKDEQFGQNK